MSLDNKFLTFLKEDNTNPSIPSPGNIIMGLNHDEQERLLREINSVLTAISVAPVLNPYYLVERIKTRLKLVYGLTFDDSYFLGEIGSFQKQLLPHNDTASVEGGMLPPIDNAWLKFFPHGLNIKFQFLKNGPLYNVSAEIVPVPDPPKPPDITEN